MDWARAIDRNREALLPIVALLFAMLGLTRGEAAPRIAPALRQAVLRLLRPTESAVRRLIVIAARSLAATPNPAPAFPAKAMGRNQDRTPAFRLFDPRKRFENQTPQHHHRLLPRIHVFGPDPRVAALWQAARTALIPARRNDGLVDATRLGARLKALKQALDNLPRQARRLARWRLRSQASPRLKFKSPLRPGPPPGHRKRPDHQIDAILAECHGLACDALLLDTS